MSAYENSLYNVKCEAVFSYKQEMLSIWGERGSEIQKAAEERPGLSCAGHSQFQSAPTNPPQDTAEPRSHDGDTSGEACVRNGKMLPGSEEGNCEKQLCQPWGERRFPCSPQRKDGGAGIALQLMEDHDGADIHTPPSGGSCTRATGYTLKEAEAHELSGIEQPSAVTAAQGQDPMLEQGKRVWRKEHQKAAPIDWP